MSSYFAFTVIVLKRWSQAGKSYPQPAGVECSPASLRCGWALSAWLVASFHPHLLFSPSTTDTTGGRQEVRGAYACKCIIWDKRLWGCKYCCTVSMLCKVQVLTAQTELNKVLQTGLHLFQYRHLVLICFYRFTWIMRPWTFDLIAFSLPSSHTTCFSVPGGVWNFESVT